jgi:hypothetical protein
MSKKKGVQQHSFHWYGFFSKSLYTITHLKLFYGKVKRSDRSFE